MAPDLSDQERALLSRCPLFLGVEDALLRSLPALPGVTVEPFAAGEVLYGPGQFRQSLGVILSGQVQVTNGSLSVSLLRAGELFGAAALYNDAPEFAAVLTAQSPCRVLFLPQETLDRLPGGGAPPPPQLPPVSHRAHPVPVRTAALGGPDRRGGEAGPIPADRSLRRTAAPVRHRSGQAPGHQPAPPWYRPSRPWRTRGSSAGRASPCTFWTRRGWRACCKTPDSPETQHWKGRFK